MTCLGRASLICLLLVPAAAFADEFSDFRIPEHKVFSWTGRLSASAGHGEGDFFYGRTESGGAQGTLGTSAYWLHDSEPRLTTLSINLQGTGQRTTSEADGVLGSDRNRRRSTLEDWSLGLNHRQYPWNLPVGIEVQAAAFGRYTQFWTNERSLLLSFAGDTDDRRTSTRDDGYDYRVIGGAALGVGRVRDATVVYEVWVLERRLRNRGVLRGPLSDESRRRLAALIYNRSSYISVLDRPGRTFWEGLIEILKRDDSFRGDWDPVPTLRALEPFFGPTASSLDFLPHSPIARPRGWFAGAASQILYFAQISRHSSSAFEQSTINDTLQSPVIQESNFRQHFEFRQVLVGPRVEWHRPFGPRWQADTRTEELFQTRGAGGMSSFTNASLAWIVTDRWVASASTSHQLTLVRVFGGTFDNAAWAANFNGAVSWFVEDHLQLSVNAGVGQSRTYGEYRRDYQTSLSLGYRFAGRIENPGLTEPIRVP